MTTNLKHGGGPKSTKGKLISRNNARKHNIFTRQLNLSGEEQREFDEFRAALYKDLQPTGPLLALLFDDLVACAWRVRISLRCEQHAVEMLDSADESEALTKEPKNGPPGKSELRSRLRLLDNLEMVLRQNATLYPELEAEIIRSFGVEFWNTLMHFKPTDIALMHLMQSALERSRLFQMKPPLDPPRAEQERLYQGAQAELRLQMIEKLIDLKRQDLQLALQTMDGRPSGALPDRLARLDLFIRYHTTAHRDFQRALNAYLTAKSAFNSTR